MKTVLSLLRKATPKQLRKPLGDLGLRRVYERLLGPERLYDEEYINGILSSELVGASVMVESMMEVFNPKSVSDFGCGPGHFLAEFRKRGVQLVQGCEFSRAAIQIAKEKFHLDIIPCDFSKPEGRPYLPADLVICFEVAEHVPSYAAEGIVEMLCACATGGTIVFSAAQPGQTGVGHVNCQPKVYWVALFEKYGFCLDEMNTNGLIEKWIDNKSVMDWAKRNVMVIRKFIRRYR